MEYILDKNMNKNEIIDQLENKGFVVFKSIDFDEFEKKLCDFSKISWITNIKFIENRTAFPFTTKDVKFHTDYPFADYIAWYCYKPCQNGGGTSLLKDIRKILPNLSSSEIEYLSSVKFWIGNFDESEYQIPFNLSSDTEEKYYFQPYRYKYSNFTTTESNIITEFEKLIDLSDTVSIHLEAGDCLIINNNFMLHGRTRYTDKERHLKRYMLEKKTMFLEKFSTKYKLQ